MQAQQNRLRLKFWLICILLPKPKGAYKTKQSEQESIQDCDFHVFGPKCTLQNSKSSSKGRERDKKHF